MGRPSASEHCSDDVMALAALSVSHLHARCLVRLSADMFVLLHRLSVVFFLIKSFIAVCKNFFASKTTAYFVFCFFSLKTT